MIRTFKYRLQPTRRQVAEMRRCLIGLRQLYNAALEQRIAAYRMRGIVLSMYDQQKELTSLRADSADYKSIPAVIEQDALRRLDRAYQAFFRRVNRGGKAGFPRFRGWDRYNTFGFPAAKVTNNYVAIPIIGHVRFRKYRVVGGIVKSATITLKNNRWWVSFSCDIGDAPTKCPISTATGVDMGLTNFATLSNGETIPNPRFAERGQERLAKRQQSLSRKQKGSKSRERAKTFVGRAHEHIHNQRLDHARKTAAVLYNTYDLIAHEDLNIRGMVEGSRFAKSINDAAWRLFIGALTLKAEYAGKWCVPVNPRGTTQRCSGCQQTVPKTLAERNHLCPQCGLALGRDHNAARNILALGVSVVVGLGNSQAATECPDGLNIIERPSLDNRRKLYERCARI